MFKVEMADRVGNHRCFVEENVPIALILTSRWQDGAVYDIRLPPDHRKRNRPDNEREFNRTPGEARKSLNRGLPTLKTDRSRYSCFQYFALFRALKFMF